MKYLFAPIYMMAFIFMAIVSVASASDAMHKVAFQVNQNDPASMNMALNNASNVDAYFKAKGESVEIEIVAYGPGLMMYHAAKSPVKERIATMGLGMDNLTFSACGNTHRKMSEKAGKEVVLLDETRLVPAGVVRLMELQSQGWSYIKP